MSTSTLPAKVTAYRIRSGSEIHTLTQAELFHYWETGQLDEGAEYHSPAGEKWLPLHPFVETAMAAAKAQGRIYHVAINQRRQGPFTREEMVLQFARRPDAAYWREGMKDWVLTEELIGELPADAPAVSAPAAAPAQPRLSTTGRALIKAQRSRGLYIFFAICFGGLGLHDFYAGHISRGVAYLIGGCSLAFALSIGTTLSQVIAGVLAVTMLLPLFAEIVAERHDGDGDPMA